MRLFRKRYKDMEIDEMEFEGSYRLMPRYIRKKFGLVPRYNSDNQIVYWFNEDYIFSNQNMDYRFFIVGNRSNTRWAQITLESLIQLDKSFIDNTREYGS